MELNSLNRKILYELDTNSRQTNTEIARRLRIDKSIVNYRIKNLIRRKIIEEFYTVIDTTKLGYEGYRGYFKWQYMKPEIEKQIIKFMVKSPLTWWVGSIEGEWDLGFVVWAKNVYELRKFWMQFMSKYQKYVIRYLLTPYTRVYDYSFGFLSDKKEKKMRVIGGPERVLISDKAKNILRIFGENARMSNTEIAKRTGYTPGIVKYQIRRMIKDGIIKGFRVKINTEKIGYFLYKINFRLKDQTKYDDMLAYASSHPNIIYVDETIGFADFEAEILVSSYRDFQKILREMKSIFSDKIREANYFVYSRAHKITYFQ